MHKSTFSGRKEGLGGVWGLGPGCRFRPYQGFHRGFSRLVALGYYKVYYKGLVRVGSPKTLSPTPEALIAFYFHKLRAARASEPQTLNQPAALNLVQRAETLKALDL